MFLAVIIRVFALPASLMVLVLRFVSLSLGASTRNSSCSREHIARITTRTGIGTVISMSSSISTGILTITEMSLWAL